MRVPPVRVLVFILVTGPYMRSHTAAVSDRKSILDALMSKGDNSFKDKEENPYISQFLDEHSRPTIRLKKTYDSTSFILNVDSRYEFRPEIKMAPFSSSGEPWPLPKKYKYAAGKVLNLDKKLFDIKVLNNKCIILTEAVARYKKIIQNHIVEEHYEFVFNYDQKTYSDRKKLEEKRYGSSVPMIDLEIEVVEDDCWYPHIDMKESYKLTLMPNMVKLTADQVWGALRGLETFSQLLFRKRNTDEIYAKLTDIEDEPRFPHRGILVDTSRHFIHMDTIKQVLDGMSYNKMNVFHWHIVDDNSFPYQSEVYPKLSEKGAYHPDLVYTIKDIKEIVEYARYRGIRVIPEFDTPGHTFSWLGHPEIKSTCFSKDGHIQGPIGPINPAKDETYTFMSNLFSEIFEVFPDSFVHLGGDELGSKCWATNPTIAAYLQEHANIPAHEARSNAENYVNLAVGYYFKRLIETLRNTADEKRQRKSFIMWEDVLKNTKEIPRDSILQVWMAGQVKVISLNQRGYRALYSSCWYLDHYKPESMWPNLYKCDPSPYMTQEEEKGNLMGGEACVWTEYITSDTLMSFMWPRASAPAERLWSPKAVTDLISAQRRIQEQRCRMIYRGLPTGHLSGPDYCLRPKYAPPNISVENESLDQPEVQYALRSDMDYMPISVIGHYHPYLPMLNVLLSLTGLYLVFFATCRWRRKGLCRVA